MTSIPGIETFHPRESWQDPAEPVYGPPAEWIRVTTNVAHYTAADDLIDGDPGESADDLPQFLKNMQHFYKTQRGYSVGYLFAIDWLGGVWELRGFDYRSAANKGSPTKTGVRNFNAYSFPVLFLVDGNDSLTAEASHSARMLYREAERRAGRVLGRPKPHSEIDYTSCCGDGIRDDIKLGLLDPANAAVEPPPPPPPVTLPPTSGADMQYIEPPTRGFDSRGNEGKKAGAFTHSVHLQNFAGIPAGADAVELTITVTDGDEHGYATVWSGAGATPNVSCLNWQPGEAICNTTVTRVSGGAFKVYLSSPANLIVDILGYQDGTYSSDQ